MLHCLLPQLLCVLLGTPQPGILRAAFIVDQPLQQRGSHRLKLILCSYLFILTSFAYIPRLLTLRKNKSGLKGALF